MLFIGALAVFSASSSTIEYGVVATRTAGLDLNDATWLAAGESATSAVPPSTAVARAVSSVTIWKVIDDR